MNYNLCKPKKSKRRLHGIVRRWRKSRPRSGGWWMWREGGRDRVDKLLLTAGGTEVATDDDWEQATGKPAEHDGWVENYWAMTATTQKEMPGLWMKAPNVAS
jgi:hypothetical protein